MSQTVSAPSAATVRQDGAGRRGELAAKILTVLLALFFGTASGAPKLFQAQAAVDAFDRIGWGDWFMYTVGALEVLGAAALLVPLLSEAAALAFVGLLAGATVFNLTVLDAPEAVLTTVAVAALCGFVARVRRGATVRLLHRLRTDRP
ncbi:DoxX family protein [Streptomyces qinglanensis]|uniref:DoxX-like family protein n=1 Tax=Streptomyces qinglanensis TaxID=943816 RepID=A0A1H9VQU6_9ACTN|nr:DoxX family protein [Streptomyces qinglanensis]SES23959.1 DoxX-like family protein [Streptomyces qinglanensis]